MASKILSILIGSEVVKICEVALSGRKKVNVYQAMDLELSEGLCEDGVIKDVDVLASAIKSGMANKGFSTKKVIFTLSSKRIANKEVIIPYVKEKRIREILKANAAEYFPVANIDEYILNYSILERMTTEEIRQYRLSVTATPIEIIEDYYNLAEKLKFSIESIDYSGNSILQLLRMQMRQEVNAILQMGSENTIVNIMNGDVLVMQRNVPYGRETIADAVRDARGVSEEMADDIIVEEELDELVSAHEPVADAVQFIVSSIGRILEFYTTRNVEKPIVRLLIIGDGASIFGIDEYLEKYLELPVTKLERLTGVENKSRGRLSPAAVTNYLSNIGAVLSPIGLTLDAVREEKKREAREGKLPWWVLILASIGAIIMVGVSIVFYFSAKLSCDSVQAQINSLQDTQSIMTQYESVISDYADLKHYYESTQGANESLYQFVTDLESIQPSSISIAKLDSKEGALTIEGSSVGKNAVAEFISQLKELSYVQDVWVEYITEIASEDAGNYDTFSLTCTLLNFTQTESTDGEGGAENE